MLHVPHAPELQPHFVRLTKRLFVINRDAIHFACASGHADLVQILAVDFAQSGNEDDRQRTPLHYAVDYERLDIVKGQCNQQR